MKEGEIMYYLVDMTLVSHTKTPQEGIEFINVYVLPTLAMAQKMEEKGLIVGGGLRTGEIGLSVIFKVDSLAQLDEAIESLPIWPRMSTKVTPLTSFSEREQHVKLRLEAIKKRMQERAEQTA